ncbi:MAG: hypothetical protein K2V38_06995, partial [Gemmataceae bacterium]|nr:hypothetical protein [Gemmataceae bacterium]
SAWLAVANSRLRHQWSRQFTRRLNWRQLRAVVGAEPGRFVVHIRYFGGFDATPLRPAAVLEDRVTGELSAVHPPSWRVPHLCERHGVELVRG